MDSLAYLSGFLFGTLSFVDGKKRTERMNTMEQMELKRKEDENERERQTSEELG